MKNKSTIQRKERELTLIQIALSHFPDGALIEQIENSTTLNLPRRTLQRRLATLQKSGKIYRKGKTKTTKYYLVNAEVTTYKHDNETVIPLSTAGKQVLAIIQQPIQKRIPIGYQRTFLHAYTPNTDHYLSETAIKKLTTIGQMPTPQIAGTYARDLLNRLLIDLSWNSSRLEGNTYSLLDTQRLLAFGQAADGKSTAEAQMILNHKDAIEFLIEGVEDIGFNHYTLLNLHGILSNNLLPDPQACGRLRSIAIAIHHSVFEPLAVPQLIAETFAEILEKAEQIENPFEQAFFMMVHLPYLQAFDDVNKRVSRLAANISLIKHNFSPLSFVDVPNDLYIAGILGVYELNRIELLRDVFIWAYQRSAVRYAALQHSLGEPDPFRLHYRDEIKQLVSSIIAQMMSPKMASKAIQHTAKQLPEKDQFQFIESVETELLSLHEGNFARYQIRPSMFKAWKILWAQTKKD
jgi:Fic family protein